MAGVGLLSYLCSPKFGNLEVLILISNVCLYCCFVTLRRLNRSNGQIHEARERGIMQTTMTLHSGNSACNPQS